MHSQISRRGFLKLLSLCSLSPILDGSLCFPAGASSVAQNQERLNVLVLVLDALAANNVSLYGYPRDTTPNLTRFAQRATVYHAHYAGGSFTSPGTASLLTGTYPWTSRAFNLAGIVANERADQNLFRAFDGTIYHRISYTQNYWVTLQFDQFRAQIDLDVDPGEFCLADRRFYFRLFPWDKNLAYHTFPSFLFRPDEQQTGSLLLGLFYKLRAFLDQQISLKRNAATYPRGIPDGMDLRYRLEDTMDGIQTLIGNSPQPFLAYFHLLAPHDPYNPRREFIGRFDDGWNPVAKPQHFLAGGHTDEFLNAERLKYDEYVANVDAEFGRLYDSLLQAGVLENTCLVVTADHGESFERGIYGHLTPTLYEPVIHVPLLIAIPGQQQREDVWEPTSCVDLLPSLLYATGQAIPDWCEGEVLPRFGGQKSTKDRSIFAVDAQSNAKLAPLTRATVAMRKGPYKLIHYFGYDGHESEYELFDLTSDPEEMDNLYQTDTSVAAELQTELQQKLQEVNEPYSVQ